MYGDGATLKRALILWSGVGYNNGSWSKQSKLLFVVVFKEDVFSKKKCNKYTIN